MYKILKKEQLAQQIYLMDVQAPRLAKSARPGQFLIVIVEEDGERIPLTICDYDVEKGTVTIVFQVVGKSTEKMSKLNVGDFLTEVVGPLGLASEFIHEPIEKFVAKKFLFVAGGVGTAPVYPQVKWFHEQGIPVDVIIGARTKDLLFMVDEMRKVAKNVYLTTDDGSEGFHGRVTDVISDLIEKQGKTYDEVIAIGPMIMMKFVSELTKKYDIKTVVSLNTLMVDGTGMCGACRVTVGGKVRFSCVDGPEFDGHQVDFDEAIRRQGMYRTFEIAKDTEEHRCNLTPIVEHDITVENFSPPQKPKREDSPKRPSRVPVRVQDPIVRSGNFEEVCYGYNLDEATREAQRCLLCKNPKCVLGCPVAIDIPAFIAEIKNGNIEEAARIIAKDSALPAVCGRVCPQETQCEKRCILGIKGEPVDIGKLERFVGDWSRQNQISFTEKAESNHRRVAVIGSGPAGLTCAGDLAKMGYDVTIFEALHEAGGVLIYGIPEFRLPKKVVKYEIENLKKLGVKIETNVVIGKTVTIDDLIDREGFEAVFIGSGAGLPKFMNIPGETLNGAVSANEILTRSNLMKAYESNASTPVFVGKKIVIVGGGNVAMDAARVAKRLGAETHIVYRRTEAEMPARVEEVHHAHEEGIIFNVLTNPVEILGDENGWVKGLKCIRMELGEPDESGRRSPVEISDSEFVIDADAVVMSLGTSPNPLIASTTDNLEVNRWKCVVADEATGQTSRKGVFAGGDIVTGAATVILAMGAGRAAAKGIDEYLNQK
ncbi:MAG: bifunctional dihydroorotate dehydrogenase B NAD binding subunit/NADPH-dependent glutamate synthase [Bacteroidales bacterium]|nr:bifunctional dihydroorotate dehydrogenase B NAD binding subunit/NADPH-dependent glutamate synthase [Bacteroidales bacterium]